MTTRINSSRHREARKAVLLAVRLLLAVLWGITPSAPAAEPCPPAVIWHVVPAAVPDGPVDQATWAE